MLLYYISVLFVFWLRCLFLNFNCRVFLYHHLPMDSSLLPKYSRWAFQQEMIPRKNSKENLDRFIPNRSAMNFDFAHYMLFQGRNGKENSAASSPSEEAYQRRLKEVFGMNRTRILAFKNKPPAPVELAPQDFTYFCQSKPAKPQRYIPQTSEHTLDAPNLIDDFC